MCLRGAAPLLCAFVLLSWATSSSQTGNVRLHQDGERLVLSGDSPGDTDADVSDLRG